MDDITPNVVEQGRGTSQPIGCSTISINEDDNVIFVF